MTILPPEMRTHVVLLGSAKSQAELETFIIAYLNESRLGVQPLHRITLRFNGTCARLGTSVHQILNKLQGEGRLTVKRLDGLNKTFVFSAEAWADILTEESSGEFLWSSYEKILGDYFGELRVPRRPRTPKKD